VKAGFFFNDPCRQWLRHYQFPGVVLLLHPENDTVATIIAYIYGKKALIGAAQFPEIKLTQAAIHFQQSCELNVPDKFYAHIPMVPVLKESPNYINIRAINCFVEIFNLKKLFT